ncbi:MAG TPA: DUF4126 domain-containing protein [Gemmatimonadales bacterium]|nr:DUF4126 domain-containing protein [Gemmatimonadales bacterium]
MGELTPLQTLGFALGTSFASGLNLYATVAAAGLFQRFGVVQLPPSLQVLASPVLIGIALTMFVIEFVADKIPFVDSAWDAIHTFIRPPAAALIAYSSFGSVPDAWKIGAALLAGSVALTSHGAKASMRAAANTSPEPFSNWFLSTAEDVGAVGLSWLAATHPLLTAGIVIVLVVLATFVIWKLAGFLRRVVRRLRGMPPDAGPVAGPAP